MKKMIIIGAGGHGRVCLDIARRAGYDVIGFCDQAYASNDKINDVPIIAHSQKDILEWKNKEKINVFIALGNQKIRKEWFSFLKDNHILTPSLIDPSIILSPYASIGQGTVVMPGVIINANAKIGEACILNTACSLDHDVCLEEGVQISPGCSLAGNVIIGAWSFLGTGTSVIPGIVIGSYTTLGAGSVVVNEIPGSVLAMGVPAKVKNRAESIF
jgi:sugar O-acyltransferase (sialic acid O-acetyltransferase NeuD family)